ncbi:Protein transport protein sec31 [Acrodontium crateriforme]|uniref:Protein transport protein SEC31 n=1 Tax=Acrodontium crateriforme TaxID=150365 RepID=A0AAQ3R9R4_9PEZI|nr:Protein transport protein sec31 [Acrodontium crateriforme]
MVRLREISRTAVFAWSPGSGAPLLITGTRTGAIGEDFSSETKLELWDLGLEKINQDADLREPLATITTDAGFNDVAWSDPSDEHPEGVIAGALENGSVDLWDVAKLREGASDALISRTTKHTGAVKALQWNPYRHNLLASVGAKGEIYIYDLGNMSNAVRLGASSARADDIECLDWNKQEKTAHILATGSSGGFVTVWDVKAKRDIITLNNQGRKAVSAVAWDPEESTKLATATSFDQEAIINLWSLKNSSAPERTLKGHELGVLGLSWCIQDPELLLSCGKDNRTICWNPRTGEQYGDFAAGSNWAFQARWNPHNPSLIASASFDGMILITSTQATNSKSDAQNNAAQALDGEDFFAKAQTQPQSISFSLPKTPKWNKRPSSVAFGFGGKLVRVGLDTSKKSKISIENFAVDSSIGEIAEKFEQKLKAGDLNAICQSKIEEAKTDEEKADWKVIETLGAGTSRKKLREHIGFTEDLDELTKETESLNVNGDAEDAQTAEKDADDDDFFGGDKDGDNFLADLAATKGAKTNNPFSIYTESETAADKSITRALMLGQFENALDICLKEDRMSDAFMIAVCGGQTCIDKAQNAYLKKKSQGPNYLRLLASIVGKNLWDVVHNADIKDWKEVMATLCTYADETEFSDLCEALGDRLEEAYQESKDSKGLRKDASFCYLAGSKLEKVVNNWVEELQEQEKTALDASENDNNFSVHAKCLQDFIEKVAVFRQVTNFQDSELQASETWKLAPLYNLYAEYADILAAHGQLATAEQYLNLLPPKYNGADSSQQRVRQANKKASAQKQAATTAQRQPAAGAQRATPLSQPAQSTYQPQAPLINQARNATPSPYAPPALVNNNYAPMGYQPPQPAAPYGQPSYGGYQPPQPAAAMPPPRASTGSPAILPAASQKSTGDWNDMPEGFIKQRQPISRRNTPGPQATVASPFPNVARTMSPAPPQGPPQGKPTPPLPPPPKAGESPSRVMSPPMGAAPQMPARPPAVNPYAPAPSAQSPASNPYAPVSNPYGAAQPPISGTLPSPMAPPVARGASPYQPPPSTSNAAPSNRYAPAPGSQPSPGPGGMPPQRTVAPNPYAQPAQSSPYASQQPPIAQAPPPTGPPPRGPPKAAAPPPPSGPPRGVPAPPVRLPTPAADMEPQAAAPVQTQAAPPAAKAKHPRGDRSHIPASAQPIVDLLTPEIARIKTLAPQAFKAQVDDMEKRINILFDHLNNGDLLKSDTVQEMLEISRYVASKDWERAQALFTDMQTAKLEKEGTHWMVGIKRLIALGRAAK